jgi:folylpolyglutamate synthase/dihydropteroate synthase
LDSTKVIDKRVTLASIITALGYATWIAWAAPAEIATEKAGIISRTPGLPLQRVRLSLSEQDQVAADRLLVSRAVARCLPLDVISQEDISLLDFGGQVSPYGNG